MLVFDAAQRAALAVTRSLGRAGHRVTVADEEARTLAGASRHAAGRLVYPSPLEAPDAFVEWVERTLASGAFDAAVPVTEVATDLVARYRARWPGVHVPLAPIETIDALSDKARLYERAVALGVPVPRSVIVRDQAMDVPRGIDEIGFPAVLKPARSRVRRPERFLSTSVVAVADAAALTAALRHASFQIAPFLYQERIAGHGEGVFALYDRGQAVAWFAHRRLREKPPEGGVSVLSESAAVRPPLLELSKRLLDDAKWHGPAMVEFRVTDAGEPYLMEVNARFWGSLQLAIDAGVDFPRLALGGVAVSPDGAAPGYRAGRRLRWFLGDLDRLYILTVNCRRYGIARVLAEWLAFVAPRPFTTRHETFRWSDPGPAARELADYLRQLGR